MRLFVRYSCAFMGGFLAMSAHIYWLFGRGDWLAPQRLSATIGNALIFAHILALMVILARDIVQKPTIVRFSVGLIVGTMLGTLAWLAHLYLFLFQTNPNSITLLIGGFGLAIGFVLTSILNIQNRILKLLLAVTITTIAIYAPIYFSHQANIADSSAQALLYFQADNPNDIFLIGLPFAITIAIFGNLPILLNSSPHAKT